MAIDATMRKLRVPPKCMPYLERNRVYDLFYELGNLLGLHRPDDHVLFLRNALAHMNETKNKPRLILLASPFMNRKMISDAISEKTGQVVISRSQLLGVNVIIKPKKIAELANAYIVENDLTKKGWIMFDYPSTEEEAKELLLTGTFPTHTLLLDSISQQKTPKELWLPDLDLWSSDEVKNSWNTYQRLVRSFRYTFRKSFAEVNTICKSIEKILENCTNVLMQSPMRGPPDTPRIVLIGARGTRRGQIAQRLSSKLGLIPVDMEELIEEAKLGDGETAEQIRFLDERKVPLYASIILNLLRDRLMQLDCLTKGWVLIRFPRDRADLQAIDSFDTPPNRIVFLNTNDDTLGKLRDIRINKYTGDEESKAKIVARALYREEDNYFIHPTDDEERIVKDHEKYSSVYEEMLDYCGDDCAVIDATMSLEEVVERIESIINKGTGVGGPRLGHLKHEIFCTKDTWGLGEGKDGLLQEHTARVTSTPYLHQFVLPSSFKQPNCKQICDK